VGRDPHADLAVICRTMVAADKALCESVPAARTAGRTWSQIAASLGPPATLTTWQEISAALGEPPAPLAIGPGRAVIEVLYLPGCPHIDGLGDHLEQLVSRHGFHEPVVVRRIDSDAQARAEHFLGSPTVRVNGRDVDPGSGERHACGLVWRIYPGGEGTPPDDWILAALNGMKARRR
jgi:hypothetical protein